jgi:HSP20 family protein
MALIRHRFESRLPDLWPDWPPAWFPSFLHPEELFRDAEGRGLIKVEEFTEEGNLVVRAELPGIDPEQDVQITVDGGQLQIMAERREEEEKEGRRFHRRELRYGSFSRTVPLPEGTDEQAISASYRNGVLEVRVPTPQAPSPGEARRIPITRG